MSTEGHGTMLVVYGSRFGRSEEIARTMGSVFDNSEWDVEYAELTKKTAPDSERHQAFVLVTSVRYGYFDKNAYRFIDKYRGWLESVPTLLGTVSLTARNPEKRDPQVHSYTKKFLEKSEWKPTTISVLPGALEYSRYNFFDKKMIQLIMRITQGPTDPSQDVDYTDWDEVRQIARDFVAGINTSSQN